MKIDITEMMPNNTRIELDEELQKNAFDKALKLAESQKQLADALGLNRFGVFNLQKCVSNPTLETLKKIQNLSGSALMSNEITITIEASSRKIKLKRFLEINDEFLWFLGFWEGDNSDNKNNLGIGNTDTKIVRRATNFLKELVGEKEISVRFEFPLNMKITKEIEELLLKEIGIQNPRSIKSINKKGRQKTFIEIKIYSTPLKRTFLNIRELLRNKLIGMPENFKTMFLQGFLDADGSINIKKEIATYWQKGDEKGYQNLKLVKNLLDSLKIRTSKIKKQSKKRDIIRLDVLKGQKGENIGRFIKNESTSIEKSEKIKIINSLLLRH